ncbi:ferrous iron transport protein B [Thermoflexus sp.]|uniref:ferrous iron transport protein B n=3 Tax=Thermoflexus sp. TaxID=1969742 RepID=UPI002639721F|nr:ferrous iron transport protein B [Thermoflexus sp.]MCX7690809.1 ferrous iron transport protein B [Thermoflexus sp.]
MHPPQELARTAAEAQRPVVLVGPPNVGKSALFFRLTGRYATVSNYPGTTVDLLMGRLPDGGPLLDTPGTRSLFPLSAEEQITQAVLLTAQPQAVIQVADARQLRQALLLTLQLAELEVPMVLDLNLMDEAQAEGVEIDLEGLAARLGVPVVATVAVSGQGLDRLRALIPEARVPRVRPTYDPPLEEALQRLEAHLPPGPGRRYQALGMLLHDPLILQQIPDEALREEAAALRRNLEAHYGRPLPYVLARQRHRWAEELLKDLVRRKPHAAGSWARLQRQLDAFTLHPVAGWLIIALVLWATYQFVGIFGAQTLVGFLEETVFGIWLLPWITALAERWIPWPLVRDFLFGPYGQISMALTYGLAIVLPIVSTFFLVFSLMEDSGYLPRLAAMLNRPFKAMGLNGRAVLPLVLGLGCVTMATMTTRVLHTRKERVLVTLLLALAVPCSAQLGVIFGMIAMAGPAALGIWLGIVAAVLGLVGLLAARVIPGESSDFILELPPLRMPRLDNLLAKTLARLEWYLKEVVPLFMLSTAILFALDRLGWLGVIESAMAPLVSGWLGLPPQTAGMFLLGFLRRDYGATGLFDMALEGLLTPHQVLVSLVVITLFIPCMATVIMMIREHGWRTAMMITAFVFPFAFFVGGLVHWGLLWLAGR